MFRCVFLGLSFVLLVAVPGAKPDKNTPSTAEQPPFTLPPGFVAEKVAASPIVEHPVMANFDDQGRLYLAHNAGVNLRANELLVKKPSSIRRLVDDDGDGKFDSYTVFAKDMTFPMGALWHNGSVYACSPPSLWKFEDRDGDGVAEHREEFVTKFGFNGNAASIHGPFLGPDGWLYWTDGRHGHEITKVDGKLTGKAARIFRCRPDGTGVEVVCGGGMDDPVEIAFADEGEPIATVDIFFGRPSRVDALIHCVWGGAFPYHPSVLGEFKKTGDLLPLMTDLGWVAPSGLVRYRSETFGPEYKGNLFSCQFNTHKIVRHVLKRSGATFTTIDEDFLVSTNPDFHPTDVLEDADGSLLVIDTGGWFRIGCPTSQIAKPQFKGAIWRIRKQGASVDDPRGRKLAWKDATNDELVARLDDPRFAVRDRTIQTLRNRGAKAVPALAKVFANKRSEEARRNAVWVLASIDSPNARAKVRSALRDASASVRQAAVRSVSLARDAEAVTTLCHLVGKEDESLAVQRQAGSALGRMQSKRAVPVLLDRMRGRLDRFLEHALIYALIEIADPKATRQGLQAEEASVQRGALIALDQMERGNLRRDEVAPLLRTTDDALRQTALRIVSEHPDWASAITDWLGDELRKKRIDEKRRQQLHAALVQLSKDQGVQNLIGTVLTADTTSLDVRGLLAEVIAEAPVAKVPQSWIVGLRRSLAEQNESLLWQTVTTVRTRGIAECDADLLEVVACPTLSPNLRVLLLATLGPRTKAYPAEWFGFLRSRLQPDEDPLVRLAAADALRVARLSDDQLSQLCELLPGLDSLALPRVLFAFEQSKNKAVGERLVGSLRRAKAVASLSSSNIEQVLKGYPPEVRKSASPILAKLDTAIEEQKRKLDTLVSTVSGGDARRGRAVFFGKKAICSACHVAGGVGGKVGPDLSKIGSIRSERDLLEAILLPSASVVRDYEAYHVATNSGQQHVGLLQRETPEAVYLINAERKEIRIARSEIDVLSPSPTSLMPQGIDKQLSTQQIRDLIAYLRSLK